MTQQKDIETMRGATKDRNLHFKMKDCETGPYIKMYTSMTNSPAYISLTGNQRALYMFCRFQEYNKDNKPGKKYRNLKPGNNSKSFFMSWDLVQEIKLYKSENTFYKDLKRLIELGFIDCLYYGKPGGNKSIYVYSDKWRNVKRILGRNESLSK